MKSVVVALLVLVSFSPHTFTQNTREQMAQETSIEQEIMKLEQQWGEAIRSGDKTFVQKLRAQEFILTNSSGKVVTKAQLESIQHSRGPIPPVKFLTGDLKVQVYPSMAVATGWIRFEEPVRNLEFVFEYRFTHVWVKGQAGWQVVAAQYTSVGRGISLGPA